MTTTSTLGWVGRKWVRTAGAVPLALAMVACGDGGGDTGSEGDPSTSTGGLPGTGGLAASGGFSAVGGSVASGGVASGGVASGGAIASGGEVGSGGVEQTGGSGGEPSTGGAASGGTASTGGTAATGGNVGTGGVVGTCPNELVGWATVSGDSVAGTTGGGNAAPVTPKTAQELIDYAADDMPRVIHIQGTFNVPKLQIASNKTLIGIGDDATLNGGVRVRGYKDDMVKNVIIRNLHVNGATTDVDNDAVQLYFAHHVWIDHCDIYDGPDGNLDMSHAVNWVTVSWTTFRYTANYQKPSGETNAHKFSSLIGHSDNNAAEDTGRLKISFHHNWWGEGVIERMPRVRFGQVHVFNNYFSSDESNYCVRAGKGASVLIEGNYFDGVNNPHEFNSSADQTTAHITARNNEYDGTSGKQETNGGGTAFSNAPYGATVESAAGIPALVTACAGPR